MHEVICHRFHLPLQARHGKPWFGLAMLLQCEAHSYTSTLLIWLMLMQVMVLAHYMFVEADASGCRTPARLSHGSQTVSRVLSFNQVCSLICSLVSH